MFKEDLIIMTVSEAYQKIFPNQENPYKDKEKEILIEEEHLCCINEYLCSIKDIKERKKCFEEIFAKPTMENGKTYEYLVYAWLRKKGFKFKTQVPIAVEKCLKANEYLADGELEGIIFDVKKFGISFPIYTQFEKKLQDEVADYIIRVEGNKYLDTKVIEKELISKSRDWIKQLFLQKPEGLYQDYRLLIPKYNIEIRAYNKKRESAICSISEIDATQWAKENEFYFFRHGSQFCIDRPYMIICPFLPQDFPFWGKDDGLVYHAFRYLCRRIFMNQVSKRGKFLKDFDGKAKKDISLEVAMRKLSAIMFLNISEKRDGLNGCCWFYQNPNADFPVPDYFVRGELQTLGAYIDNFEYDNY